MFVLAVVSIDVVQLSDVGLMQVLPLHCWGVVGLAQINSSKLIAHVDLSGNQSC